MAAVAAELAEVRGAVDPQNPVDIHGLEPIRGFASISNLSPRP
jgi:hypothetical protein